MTKPTRELLFQVRITDTTRETIGTPEQEAENVKDALMDGFGYIDGVEIEVELLKVIEVGAKDA